MSIIAEQLSRVAIGAPLRHANLTLYPLLAAGVAEPGYRLLEAVLADGSARVTEVSEAGSVPQLRFVNEGERPVLALDGEELIGAKQNRILNLTILAPAHQTIKIPVSCVEQGRWHAQSAAFASAQRAHFATGRARKAADVSASLRQRGSRASDQGAVWRDIAEKSRRFGVDSATGAAADLYAAHRERLDAFRQAFAALPGQCGALFAIHDRVVGVELFDSPRPWRRSWASSSRVMRSTHSMRARPPGWRRPHGLGSMPWPAPRPRPSLPWVTARTGGCSDAD